jgi:hypothetical protein
MPTTAVGSSWQVVTVADDSGLKYLQGDHPGVSGSAVGTSRTQRRRARRRPMGYPTRLRPPPRPAGRRPAPGWGRLGSAAQATGKLHGGKRSTGNVGAVLTLDVNIGIAMKRPHRYISSRPPPAQATISTGMIHDTDGRLPVRQTSRSASTPEHACRWNLAPGLDQRGRVAPGTTRVIGQTGNESRLCRSPDYESSYLPR